MVEHHVSGIAHVGHLWSGSDFRSTTSYAVSYSSFQEDATFTFILDDDGSERVSPSISIMLLVNETHLYLPDIGLALCFTQDS